MPDSGFPAPPESHVEAAGPATYIQRTNLQVADRVPDPFRRVSSVFRLTGNWDLESVRKSLEAIIHRHASLRTRFVSVDGNMEQQVYKCAAFFLPTVKVSGVIAEHISVEAQRLVQDFIEQDIDLSVGPLFDVRLFVLEDDHYLLAFCVDHLIADARSMAVLYQEFLTLYSGYVQGSAPELPPVALSMVDIALSQRRTHDAWMNEHARYWKERFADAPPACFQSDPPQADITAGVIEGPMQFGPDLTTRLRQLSRTLRVPLSTTALAIYVASLSRWCRQLDLVVCLVSRGRHRAEHQNIFGLFSHRLFLRLQLSADDSFVKLVERVSNEVRAAYAHDDQGQLPLLMPDLQYFGSFNWQTIEEPRPAERPSVAGLPQLTPFPCRIRFPPLAALQAMNSKLPAALAWRPMLFLHDRPDELRALMGFPAMSLAPPSLARFIRSFLSLSEQVCDDPMSRVSTARHV